MSPPLPDTELMHRFLDRAIRLGVYSNRRNLQRHLHYLFDGIELRNKRVLDVGGGAGLLTVYAAVRGAEAVCVEPETAGATTDITAKFRQLKDAVDPQLHATLVMSSIQSYLGAPRSFDVVIIANAINHLNENACIHLLDDPAAQAEYAGVFRALFGSLRPGGWLVATDCSRANFFNDVGTTSPFMPDIEWHKHQSPGTWDRLLRQVGFAAARVQWSSPNTLGALGRLLLGNRLAAYFLLSHFRLAARKPLTAAS
ncbi:MAG TPA: class I SAM-dependent methyltransferase [Steroidobacteraceae bacterium]|jgi:SAM-dependent methyltransferase|nr:class I SAM-dependent methyltransferase [Steroidobacteraceae bacterium]